MLFTAPASRRERTAAKLCLDTLVVRAGDSAAAALFHALDGALELGRFPVCCPNTSVCVAPCLDTLIYIF